MHRTVVVTGAASGIGLAACRRFAADAWHVVAVDRHKAPVTDKTARPEIADLADPAAIERLVENLSRRHAHLDAWVNCAGVQLKAPLEATTAASWDEVMAVNLRAPFLAIRYARPLLAEGGAVVNVASVHAMATSVHAAAYAASKGGLVALTRALAVELAADRIRVNAVLPGAVDTPMLRGGLPRDPLDDADDEVLLARLAKRAPQGRIAQPPELAEAILFLADNDRSSFVTGAALVVDGGVTAHLSSE